jgi:ribonuclease P protein component
VPKKKLGTFRSLTTFTRNEIIALFRSARTKHRSETVEIRCAPKLGVSAKLLIVTPRASGNAVQRNLIRRRLKHIFYQERLFEHQYSGIVFVRKEAQKLSFEQLKELICTIFKS